MQSLDIFSRKPYLVGMIEPRDLRTRRRALDLTQAELGRLLTTTTATISDWERSKFRIRHPGMLDLALVALEGQAIDPASNSG